MRGPRGLILLTELGQGGGGPRLRLHQHSINARVQEMFRAERQSTRRPFDGESSDQAIEVVVPDLNV